MMPVASLLLSVVSPVYRADAMVAELVRRLVQTLEPLSPRRPRPALGQSLR